ncbi:MAG: precorrin-4 C(11)-methyltransferase, partial [Flavobacteriales bacterium]
ERKLQIFSPRDHENVKKIDSVKKLISDKFHKYNSWIFIGSLGICVRSIAPHIEDKKTDPAVINIDENGNYYQSVVSGHEGEANILAQKLAQITGGEAIITTSSDKNFLWSIDTLGKEQQWTIEAHNLNKAVSLFVNREPTALLLEAKDNITSYLIRTKPDFVDIFYNIHEIDTANYSLLLAVSPNIYDIDITTVYYRPKMITLGLGCEKNIPEESFIQSIQQELYKHNLSINSVSKIASLDIKDNEAAFKKLSNKLDIPFITYNNEELDQIKDIPNPSEYVKETVGCYGVAEPSAMVTSGKKYVDIEKQTVSLNTNETGGNNYNWSMAYDADKERKGKIAVIGAGPGDHDLISKKGINYLEQADLILYAGSLIPEEQLSWASSSAIVRNSATMTLDETFELIEKAYYENKLIVRLHSGDPSIYGAIQEQIKLFEEKGMLYEIVPGIAASQAAAAVLKSEFTIPEKVQTLILTRGEGKTPLPGKEKLSEMAKFQATMCIFLSARIAPKIQNELLEHYPKDTPVAVCYRLTWPDEEVWKGSLEELSDIIKQNKLTRTVLIIVGEAIGARSGRSRLYHPEWKHIFRNKNKSAKGWENKETLNE